MWISQKLFEKLTQSRKGAEKRVVFGRFYCLFAFFAPLREMNSAVSNSLSECDRLPFAYLHCSTTCITRRTLSGGTANGAPSRSVRYRSW